MNQEPRPPIPGTLGALLTKEDLEWWDSWNYRVVYPYCDDKPILFLLLFNQDGSCREVSFNMTRADVRIIKV